MKVLVTGANGYIGRHVCLQLLDKGHDVIACDLHLDGAIDPRIKHVEQNLFIVTPDIYEKLGSPDACVHMAWRDGFVHNSQNHLGDLSSHYKFLTALVDKGVKQLVVMGTMHEVGYYEGAISENTPCNPLSMYGIAKDALRRAIMLYCKDKCILQWLRGFYILGDDGRNHSIFTKILQAASEGKKTFPFTSGQTKYDFITVEELAFQIAAVVSQTEIKGIINVCSGKPVTLAERVEQYITENHLDIKLDYGAYPDRPYDSPIVYGDPTEIHQILRRDEI